MIIKDNIDKKTSLNLILITVFLCLLPIILNIFDVNLGYSSSSITSSMIIDGLNSGGLFTLFGGSLLYILLEWTVVIIAISILLIAIFHYNLNKNIFIPIISLIFVLSATIDAFQALVVVRIIEYDVFNLDFISFSWDVSSFFTSSIFFISSVILTQREKINEAIAFLTVLIFSLSMMYGYFSLDIVLVSDDYSNKLDGDKFFIDFLPIFNFFLSFVILSLSYYKNTTILSMSFLLCSLVGVFSQIYMKFGTNELFDHFFNCSHVLKVFLYTIPGVAILLDYNEKNKQLLLSKILIRKANLDLELKVEERTKKIELSRAIAKISNDCSDVKEAFHRALNEICNYMLWPVGHVYEVNENNGLLHSSNLWYINDFNKYKAFKELTEKTIFKIGEDLPGMVLKSKKIEWIEDIQFDDKFTRNKKLKNLNLHSAFAFPVIIDGNVESVFEFFSNDIIKDIDNDFLNVITEVSIIFSRVYDRVNKQKNLEMAVDRRTKELKLISDYNQSIIEASVSAIISIDQKGKIVAFNSSAERIFGYKAIEVISKNVNILVPEPYKSEHDSYIANHLKTNENKLIGKSRELTAVNKNGKIFPVLLSIGKMFVQETKEYHFIGIVTDITAQKEAEEASKAKSLFISSISHELRTPLHAILNYSKFGIEDMNDSKTHNIVKHFEAIKKSSKRLVKLIDNILDFAKLDFNKVEYKFEDENLHSIVEDCLDELQSLLIEKNISCVVESFKEVDTICMIDKIRMFQVIFNIISNSIKHSPVGGKIYIKYYDSKLSINGFEKNAVLLKVEDEGTGVPNDELSKIFDDFTQVNSGIDKGGTGLGLSISRRIIQAHKGVVWGVTSDKGGLAVCIKLLKKME